MTNSDGNFKIVRYIGSLLNRELLMQRKMEVCTSNYTVCRAIIDSLPEENLNSLVIARTFRQRLSH